jgi:ABC-type phosphate/phosphonate transport system substrate-binding protein
LFSPEDIAGKTFACNDPNARRIIWALQLIPNDPLVVRKDLPESLRKAITESLATV